MNDTPLVIVASARKQSETRHFADAVFRHTDHHLIDLLDHCIQPYRYTPPYGKEDTFAEVMAAMGHHRVIVFATPVYWYAMSGLLKTLFDRFTDVVTVQKHLGRQLQGKVVMLLATGADEYLPEGFEVPFERTAAYLHMHYKGHLYYSTKHRPDDSHLQQQAHSFLQAAGLAERG